MTYAEMEEALTKLDRRLESVEQILPTLATKEALADLQRHTDVRFDDVRDDIRKVAEAVAGLSTVVVANQKALQANQRTLEKVVKRLDVHQTILVDLTKKRDT